MWRIKIDLGGSHREVRLIRNSQRGREVGKLNAKKKSDNNINDVYVQMKNETILSISAT